MTDHETRYRAAGITRGTGDLLIDELETLFAAFERRHADQWRRIAPTLYRQHPETSPEHAWHVMRAYGLARLFSEAVARAVATAPSGAVDVRRAIVTAMIERAVADFDPSNSR